MSEHEWCQDVPRDEAVRAAEDAAAEWRLLRLGEVVLAGDEFQTEDWPWQRWRAVPATCVGSVIEEQSLTHRRRIDRPIKHRDLPEQVSLLWASVSDILGRVVRIEGEMDAGEDEEAAPAAPAVCDPASPAEGFRTERVTLEVTQRDESYTPLSEFDWDAMLRSASRGRLFDGESVRVVEQTETMRCMTKLRRERDAARAECERLRDRVAELEGTVAANAGSEKQEPMAWGVLSAGEITQVSLLQWRDSSVSWSQHSGGTVVPLYAAPPEPRGWLTAEERKALWDYTGRGTRSHHSVAVVEALLARETPPRVRRPPRACTPHRDAEWIDAIRAAGGKVEK